MSQHVAVRDAVAAAEAKLSVQFTLRQTRLKSSLYVGHPMKDGTTLVLKVIQDRPLSPWLEKDAEIAVFELLSRNTLAPKLVDFSKHGNLAWHVSEFCLFPCMTSIRTELRCDLNEAIPFVGASMLAWVQTAHKIGAAHMDIATDHVFLSETGHVQMVDFEHAVILNTDDIGLPHWADVFCVAQVLCELCTGNRDRHWSDHSTVEQALNVFDSLDGRLMSNDCLNSLKQLAEVASRGLFSGDIGSRGYKDALATFT